MSAPFPANLRGLYEQPATLLQALLRFDTTNPPGDEAACIGYIADLLTRAGLPPTILARDPARPNLVARVPGGPAPPLLLQGHIDVVTTAHQAWQHPPFDGAIADGCVWGRGALDMKGGIAMMLAAVLRAQAEGAPLPGDVVLAIVSDEEAFGSYGAGFLVAEHPGQFAGIRYALGEVGAFTLHLAERKFYPIMVAEKLSCRLRARVRGPGGHGSLVMRGGAMAKLGEMLQHLDRHRLPVHITPVARLMVETLAGAVPAPLNATLRHLLDPAQTDAILDTLGPLSVLLDPVLHHIVNATMVHGGEKINVIPSLIEIEMDARILPGFSPADLVAEVQAIVGPDVELEVAGHDPPGPATVDMGLFATLSGVLRELDPDAVPIPLLLSGVTDGRYFARLGIQSYGFLPMNLPPDINFMQTIHAADERIPVEAMAFGAEAFYRVLQRFGPES